MKQYLYTLPVAVFLSLCAACTQADIVVPVAGGDGEGGGSAVNGVPLSVKNLGLSVEVESRSIVTGGPADVASNPNPLTTVGLCVTKQSSSGVVSIYDNGNKTQVFTYNALANPAAWQLAEGEETLLLYSEKGTVYAFSPVEKSVTLTGTPKAPVMSSVKVLDKQKFYFNDGGNPVDASTDVQWETDQDDYLYGIAKDQLVDRWHPEVSLTMNHALAKVSFRVLEAEGGTAFAGHQVKQVVLKSAGGFKKSTSAKLNIATGELSGTLTAVDQLSFIAGGDLRAIGAANDATKVPVQAFGLVIPVTGASVTLELTLDDGRIFLMAPAEGSADPGTFTADWLMGNNYIYNIRMSPKGIEIADIQVAGWGEGGSTDIPVE